jgi:hypothetical protein
VPRPSTTVLTFPTPATVVLFAGWYVVNTLCMLLTDEQHTGIILTSEVCVSVRRSGDLANGRRDVWQTS